MKKGLILFNILLALLSFYSEAYAQDLILQNLEEDFVRNLSQTHSSYGIEKGSWGIFDVKDCFLYGQTCFGNNPTSPYGFPQFGDNNNDVPSFKLDPREAIIIFLRTPPKVRYFGFTQYLINRGDDPKPVFASLSDTQNLLQFKTLDSAQPGEQVFDNYAVIVWTADMATYAEVKNLLLQQNIAEDKINFIPIPIELPLYMGKEELKDTFGMLMRTALPEVPANLDSYNEEKPLIVLKVSPDQERSPFQPAPIIGYADEISGVSEDPSLAIALENLASDIQKRYARTFTFSEKTPISPRKLGWDCINGDNMCNGDNHDALYSMDVTRVSPDSYGVLVVGVNHQKTGKALYVNHSVYDNEKLAGIVSVADPEFTEKSAFYHAGIIKLSDPRRKEYKNLYAYMISYDCEGRKHCLQIPAPTEENPIGLTPGTPYSVLSRKYVDPLTGVRPFIDEITVHKVFVLKK